MMAGGFEGVRCRLVIPKDYQLPGSRSRRLYTTLDDWLLTGYSTALARSTAKSPQTQRFPMLEIHKPCSLALPAETQPQSPPA